jgi:hypothetical protein
MEKAAPGGRPVIGPCARRFRHRPRGRAAARYRGSRYRRLGLELTPNQLVIGDPREGRSALDMRSAPVEA